MAAKSRGQRSETRGRKSGRRRSASPPLMWSRCTSVRHHQPAWWRPRLPYSPMRCARRSPASSPSAICCDLRARRARAALGRHHQGGRRASGESCHAVRRCRQGSREQSARAGCARICSTCGRWRATRAIRWPAARRPRACRPRSTFPTALPSLVIGDPVRLRAALENLIDNAVKFTDAGGVALSATPVNARRKQARHQGQRRRHLRGVRQRHRR